MTVPRPQTRRELPAVGLHSTPQPQNTRGGLARPAPPLPSRRSHRANSTAATDGSGSCGPAAGDSGGAARGQAPEAQGPGGTTGEPWARGCGFDDCSQVT